MNNFQTLTRHCEFQRMQQRGVPPQMCDLMSLYGETYRRKGSMDGLYFSKESIKKMEKDGVAKRLILEAEKRRNLRFVVAKDSGVFITVEYAFKSKQRVH